MKDDRNYKILTKVVRILSDACEGFPEASIGLSGDKKTMTIKVTIYPTKKAAKELSCE